MANDPKALSLTRDLIAFNTINPPGHEGSCAEYLGKLLEDGGYAVALYEFDKSRASLIARMDGRGNNAPICFSGHIDTVPLGALSWSTEPFAGEVDGNKVYGRGSSDMKSGVASMLIACLRLAKMSKGAAGITLVITAGEETGCEGASHLVELGNVLGKAGAIVVGEPTSNYPVIGHKGSLWVEALTTGVTAHGSMPDKGINAIYKAALAVTKLQMFDFNVSPHPFLGAPTLNVGTIAGGLNINSVPDQATIGVDIRTIPGLNNSEVYEKLESYLGEEMKIRRIVDVDSVITDPQDDWIQEIFSIMESFLKEHLIPRGVAYFTDASILTPAFGNPPTVLLGPGEPSMAHKSDEFCYVSKIEEAAEAYFEIAKRWCNL
jgi:succinyl-diaminopimelate desuccinylase